MNVQALLNELRKLGVRLQLVDSQLKINAPAGTISPAHIEHIREHKTTIISYLRELKSEDYREIPVIPVMDSYPLSNSQKRLWVTSQLEKQSVAYNIPVVYKLNGIPDTAALRHALDALVARHESLRTVFMLENGEPRQYIKDKTSAQLQLQTHDFRTAEAPEKEARAYLKGFINQPFDLERGPLMRVALLQWSDDEFLLGWSVHHIIADEWSMQVMGRELVTMYNAFHSGTSPDLPALRIQYRDYASWQREVMAGDEFAVHRNYWLSQFAGELPVLELPADRHRPEILQHNGAQVLFEINPSQLNGYEQLLQQHNATLFMGITALVNILLFRYSGQSDLIIGTPVAGREHPDLEDQIGYYLNTLALRNEVKGKESFAQLLSQIRTTTISAFSHQAYPFDLLVEELGLGGDLSRSPLFDVVVILQNIALHDEQQVKMDGLTLQFEQAMLEISKSDLRFQFSTDEESGILYGNIEYNTDLYDRTRIERMARHLVQLMEAIIEDPALPVNDLVYQSEDERSDSSWFTDIQPKPAQGLIHKKIESVSVQHAERIALSGYGLELSYARLNTYANQIAHLLLSTGLSPETAVGVYAAGGPLPIALLLGTFKAGGMYVPMSPDQAPKRLQQVLSDTAMGIILTTADHYGSLATILSAESNSVHTILITAATAEALSVEIMRRGNTGFETTTLPAAINSGNPTLSISEHNRAYIFYTSGSTGQSKGIVGVHGSLSHYIRWHANEWNVDESYRISQLAPMTFDASLKDILVALISGATVCIPEAAIKHNTVLLSDWLRSEQITMLQTVPSLFRLITAALEESGKPLPSLRYVVLAGERLYGRDVKRWHAANGETARMSNLYGLTETTILKSYYHIRDWEWSSGEVLPVGYPISHTQIAVINSNNSLCEEGEIGEVYIRSPFISEGYLDRSLNEGSLVQNPLQPGFEDHVWRTGDLGRYRNDGSLEILGRRDEQVKINGVRVELEQVRGVILEQEGITRTELLVHTDEDYNQELICYYSGKRYESEELRAHLSQSLHSAMLPGYYVWLDSFPLNMNGKVDRKALPKPEEILSRSDYSAPHAGTEQQLAGLWQQVLGTARISRDDSFFNIGGSSLKAIQLIARIYKELDVQLTIAALFSHPVLSAQAVLIDQSRKASYRPIPRIADQETYPLSNAQKRLWVQSQVAEHSIVYNIPVLFRLSGMLNITALTNAFYTLTSRHESLRTVFVLVNGEPRQYIQPVLNDRTVLEIHDYRAETAPQERAKQYALQLLTKPFDLATGPLMRVALLQVADEEYLLAWSMHHIISDEWSMQVMSRELVKLYNALNEGKPADLRPLNIQYRDYTSWLHQALSDGAYQSQREYWLSRFTGDLPVLDLPADRVRPEVQAHKGSNVLFAFGKEQTKLFQQLLTKMNVTLFMGLTAVINVLLYRYSGQSDLIIGTPVAGRDHADLEDQIGYYLNTLALRNQVKGKDSFTQLLSQVKDTTVNAFSNQAYPFDKLIEELGLGNDLSRAPLFDVVIILQNIELHKKNELQLNGVSVELEPIEQNISKSDLRFQFSTDEESGILYGNIEYNTDLYDRTRIERMARHLVQLMEAIIEDPALPVNDLVYQSEDERSDSSWFTDIQPKPAQGLIHKKIESVSVQHAERIALSGYGLELSYARLNTYANQIAHLLLSTGLSPETAVGVYTAGGPLPIVLLLGTFKAGGMYVPMSPDQAPKRLQQVLSDTAMGIILTTADHYGSLATILSAESNSVHTILITAATAEALSVEIMRRGNTGFETTTLPAAINSGNPTLSISEHNRAYIFYTSGSTGQSKGIVGVHGSLSHYIRWHANEWNVDESYRISQLAPMTFDASLKDILVALISGATVCIPEAAIKHNTVLLSDWLRSEQITMLQTVPSLFRLITAALEESGKPLPSLRYVVLAGERLYGRDVKRWHAANGETARMSNLYGLTETTILKSYYHIRDWEWSSGEVLPVGYPISHTQIAVINSNNSLCEEGEIGEVYIRSPFISEGYLDRSLNEGSLVQNPLQPGFEDHVWRTGDLGRYRNDGSLEILGRRDEQVKINGVRVELEQVRGVILEQEGITRTELLVHTDEDYNQELICYYSGKRYESEELRAHLSQSLHSAMLPGYYVWLDSFPLNMNGKVDRKALPKPEEILSRSDYSAPRAGTEQQLAGLWQQVLGTARISRDDSFFNIGGSSLKAIQLIARIYKELDVQLTIATLFSHPVLSAQAVLIDQSRKASYRPIPRIADQETYPLSNAQKRMWVLSQIEEQSVAYNMTVLYKLNGNLNISALKSAFRELISRHESLRTVFILVDGEPGQRIVNADESGFELEYVDYRTATDPGAIAKQYTQELFETHFNLELGPLMRAALLQLADNEYLLAWSLHHIISDEWSMQVTSREIVALYNAYNIGKTPSIRPLPIQYRDYAAWRQKSLSGDQFTEDARYWLSRLAGELPVLELPTDHRRKEIRQYKGSQLLFEFTREQYHAYQQLLKQHDVTLFMGMTALVNVLLYRYSGQTDIILGTPVAGRDHPDLEDQIGYYLNTLALRNELKAKESFSALLMEIRETTLAAFSHQSYPFDLLVDNLGMNSDKGQSPLFSVVIVLQNIALNKDNQLQLDGVAVIPQPAIPNTARGDLRFQFSADDMKGVLHGSIEYSTDLFNEARIERMVHHLKLLMEEVISNASLPLNQLVYQSEDERSDSSWFTDIQPKPAQGLIHKKIESVSVQHAERIALSGYGLELSYARLNTYANQIAHLLLSTGLSPETAVGVYAAGGPLPIALLLGTFKAGGMYVPMSPDQAPKRLQQVLSDTAMGIILTTADHYGSLATILSAESNSVHTILITAATAEALSVEIMRRGNTGFETTTLPAAINSGNPTLSISEHNRAYIFYTSGSTGQSKGIVGVHGSLSHYIRWHANEWNVDESYRISQLAPMTFDASLKDILVALISGATVCIPEAAIKHNTVLLSDWLRSEQITMLQTVPSLFRLITAALEESGKPLPSLRYVVLAGERLYGRDVKRWHAANGETARMSNLYGLTETTILKSYYHIRDWEWSSGEVLPVGYPISHTQIAVINSNNSLCEEGEIGEVYIRSPFISEGYLDRSLNEGSLVQNPLQPGFEDHVWRTGDLGRYRNDGSLEILGRRDEQVKINGVRVELEQVRGVILEQEGITRTELLVHTDEDYNQELICYYSGKRYESEELRAHLSQSLHSAMLPGYYVWLDSFPLNMNGKVDRKALPKPEEILSRSDYSAPRAGTEQQLAGLWQQVLGTARISRDDSFFNIGGSSLKAIQLIARIYKELDVQLTIATLFSHPVLSAQAVLIDQSRKASYRPIPRIADQETYPLSNAQKRLWVLDNMEENSIAYNIPALFRLHGYVNADALDHAVRGLVNRHESLRTVFVLRDGEPEQMILSAAESGVELQLFDYRAQSTPETAAYQFVEQLLQQPFNLEKGPLVRMALLQMSENEYLLAWSIHHIIADEWSMQVMGRELIAMYNAYTGNTTPTLKPLPIQYRDFACWQREKLSGEGAAAQRKYWLSQFSGEIPVLQLPADRHRPEVQRHAGTQLSFTFDNQQFGRYKQLLKQYNATLFMGVTALVNILLYRYSGQSDLIIGTPIAGREHPDLEDQIGYYLNTLALRNEIRGTDSFIQVISRIRETTLAAFAHQSYPFDLLVEELGLGSDLSRSPLFDVVVILQNISINSKEQLEMNGVTVIPEPFKLEISKSDLRFQFFADDENGILHCNIEYNTDLYNRSRIERMSRHLCQLMEAINNNSEDNIYQIQYLVADEQQNTTKRALSFNAKIDEDLL
jgi:tyrocidine synthetase-3